jgi:signal transduction histidine kinase
VQEKLFQPFFTTKELGSGTGLGLSISKGIIEEHEGKLVYDDQSPNTKFVITLPKHLSSKPVLKTG